MRDLIRKFQLAILFCFAVSFSSCATHKDTALVNDPDNKQEGLMPWNKQEKWESQNSQFGGITDRR